MHSFIDIFVRAPAIFCQNFESRLEFAKFMHTHTHTHAEGRPRKTIKRQINKIQIDAKNE